MPRIKSGQEFLQTSIRITRIANALWEHLSNEDGLNKTAYLETILRQEAKERGLNIKDFATTQPDK